MQITFPQIINYSNQSLEGLGILNNHKSKSYPQKKSQSKSKSKQFLKAVSLTNTLLEKEDSERSGKWLPKRQEMNMH